MPNNVTTAAGIVVDLFDAVAATGISKLVSIQAKDKVLQVIMTGTATVVLAGSNDGVNWVTIGSVTASGKISDSDPWLYSRAQITAYTSGVVSAFLAY